jgi:hypothetical protein
MPVLTKDPRLDDLLKYELNGNYTREVVPLKGGTAYPLGAVLGRITASGIHRLSPAATVTGDEGAETAVAVLIEAVNATAGDRSGLVVARGPAPRPKRALPRWTRCLPTSTARSNRHSPKTPLSTTSISRALLRSALRLCLSRFASRPPRPRCHDPARVISITAGNHVRYRPTSRVSSGSPAIAACANSCMRTKEEVR